MTERVPSLDILKIAATLIIVLHHYGQLLAQHIGGSTFFCSPAFYWGLVVELFFLLSGYFMLPWVKRLSEGCSARRFLFRRWRRLVPMTALAALVYEAECLFVLYFQPLNADQFINFNLWGTITDMLCVQCGWCFHNPMINNPTWYLSVLCLCYLLMCVIVRLSRRLRVSPRIGFALMIVLGVSIRCSGMNAAFLGEYDSRGYISFFLGLLLADAMEKQELHSRKYILISALAVLGSVVSIRYGFSGDCYFLLSFVTYPALLILFTCERVQKLFRAEFWGILGKIQFHVFIWHTCLLIALRILADAGIDIHAGDRAVMLLFVLFAELFGAASYFLLEKRADQLFMFFIPEKFKEKYG